MLRYIAAISTFIVVTFANECGHPNNTDHRINTFSCNPNTPLKVLNAKVLDANEEEMYPINFNAPITIVLDAVNNGEVYVNNEVDVHLMEYKKPWFSSCQWVEMPTFGLLNGINGCEYAKNCPLELGNLSLRLPLDLSKFSGIISALLGDSSYELAIHMKNLNPGVEVNDEIACIVAQMTITS